jgi:hypothetical protein
MAKYTVATVLKEQKFLTFDEAVDYAKQIMLLDPLAVIEITNDKP